MYGAGLEIERKFLVRLAGDPAAAPGARALALRQLYLTDDGGTTRRIREAREGDAVHRYLTLKRQVARGVRREDEREIDEAEWRALLPQRDPARRAIVKTRHVVPFDGRTWEIDVFSGALDGLVLAEVELPSVEDLQLDLAPPPCIAVIRDVTDDDRYGNSALAHRAAPPADDGDVPLSGVGGAQRITLPPLITSVSPVT